MLSPSTGIVDSHGFMLALQGAAESNGAQVVLNSPVQAIATLPEGGFAVDIGGDAAGPGNRITCRNLITSAGLHASKLARTLGAFPTPRTGGPAYQVPETYYAKGQYYALEGRSPFQRHIYPMPQGAWLGLHATIDLGGRCKFGPDIAWIPEIDYGFEPEKITQFLSFIRSYYPGLDASRLHADYTGIRPKLYREGEPVPDFRFDGQAQHGLAGLILLFGIESPGLTSSMAIGDHVADLLGAGNS
jgi:L-2-hydroxyglutarate oxidase LhgO